MDEKSYDQGSRMAWWIILNNCLRNLKFDCNKEDPKYQLAFLVKEREGALSALRSLCGDFGDNEWDAKLDMADIINKHLGNYLRDKG